MLDQPVVQSFITQARKTSLRPKQTLLQAHDVAQSLYLILEGSVSILIEDSEGREMVIGYLNPGEFFGEACLIPGAAGLGTIVRTRCPTLVAELDCLALRDFVCRHPEFMLELTGQLAGRLRDLHQRVVNQAYLDVAGRLTHTLMDLCGKPDAVPHPNGTMVRISRRELARHVGCSREMAGRALKKLRDHGLVRDQGRNILIYGSSIPQMLSTAA